jgi:hypothetical protein
MTIAIEDISMTEELDRKAQTAVRGGNLVLTCPSPSEDWLPSMPPFPSFPSGFPFTTCLPDGWPRDDGGQKVYPQ